MNLPVYEALLDEEEGMLKVSLVTNPAIESDFVALSKAVQLAKEKSKVTGALLIPDKLIYREDEFGNGYNLTFSKETIERLRDKFHKDKLTSEVNTQHKTDVEGVYLVESWIVEDPATDKSSLLKLDVPAGTWMATYKVENEEVLSKIGSGEFKGFSIEAIINKTIKMKNNNEEKSLLSKLASLLGMAVVISPLAENTIDTVDNPAEEPVAITVEDKVATLTEEHLLMVQSVKAMNEELEVLKGIVASLQQAKEDEAVAEEMKADEDAQKDEVVKTMSEENVKLKAKLSKLAEEDKLPAANFVSDRKETATVPSKVFANKLKNLK